MNVIDKTKQVGRPYHSMKKKQGLKNQKHRLLPLGQSTPVAQLCSPVPLSPQKPVCYGNKSKQGNPSRKRDKKLKVKELETVTEEVLMNNLKDVTYDPSTCIVLSQTLAGIIMERIKALAISHYKLVAIVSIGGLKEKVGMQFGSRCLWNKDTDCFVSVKFTNSSLFAIAMIYGLYFE
ncbi:dynein light chain Tctex-type 5-B-like [Gigantopelta aegis]|uniref:dynein light chain Tctex-type 5-B-like n=1 Tax=Gigantopelta aegis TaxID=1735272 RepID=UPI001B888D9A|nr:dynein light chain Tctex-type 5-B-like [Gigantopelta aegis]